MVYSELIIILIQKAFIADQFVPSTSFVGVTLYCFFGTSKDISIGPISKIIH